MKWDAKSGKLLKEWQHLGSNDALEDDKEIVTIAFKSSNDSSYAEKIDLSNDSIFNIIKLPDPMLNPQIINYYNGSLFTFLTPDNSKIVISDNTNYFSDGFMDNGKAGMTRLWDYYNCNEVGSIENDSYCISIAFSNDCLFIAFSSANSRMVYQHGGNSWFETFYYNFIVNDSLNELDVSYGNPISWHWDFGDGNSSFDINPVHVYNKLEYYTVSLIVSDGNDSSSISKSDYINVTDAANVNDQRHSNYLNAFVYPNPFSEFAPLEYNIEYPVQTKISIINSIGNVVTVLSEGMQMDGVHSLEINTNNLSQGVYFCRIQAVDRIEVLKLIIIK